MSIGAPTTRTIALLLGLSILVVDLNTPLGVAAAVPYVAVVLIGLWLPERRDVIAIAVLCSLATLAGFLLSANAGAMWMVVSNRVLALGAIWACTLVILIRKDSANRLAQLEQSTRASEIKAEKEKLERSNLESQLAQNARDLQLIIDLLPVQVSRFDTKEHYVFVNRTSMDWLKTDPDNIQGKTIREVTGDEIYEKVKDRIKRSIAGEPQNIEVDLTYPDNTVRKVNIRYMPDRNTDGDVTGVIGLVIDLTDARKAEVSLAESRNRYKAIFDSANVAIIRTDLKTATVIDANTREADLLGYRDRADLLENYSAEKHWHSLQDRQKWLDRAKGNVEVLDEELRLMDIHGKDIWLHTCTVVNKEEAYIDVISVDITRVRTQEQAVLAAREEAEMANRAKSEFLANMSHELRTPLNAIIGFAQMIRDRSLGDNAQDRYADYAGDIFTSGDHLLDIINDVLDLSRIEAGKANMQLEPVDIRDIVDHCLKLINGKVTESDQTITIDISPPRKTLVADARMLKQMLLNLLSNASKFTPVSGQIQIATRQTDEDRFEISVADSGIGIDSKDLSQIMQPFGQVEDAFTRQFDGTGLGLPLVASLVDLHGGGLNIKSEPGEGTTATIWLPVT